ncbi:MAG: hypothetical protein AAF483_28085 [Planctomycetota bacterium]
MILPYLVISCLISLSRRLRQFGDFPGGTQPDRGYAPEFMTPIWKWSGTSPNGLAEYLPLRAHPLHHNLLCAFSAKEIAWMPLGKNGKPTTVQKLRGPAGSRPIVDICRITGHHARLQQWLALCCRL